MFVDRGGVGERSGAGVFKNAKDDCRYLDVAGTASLVVCDGVFVARGGIDETAGGRGRADVVSGLRPLVVLERLLVEGGESDETGAIEKASVISSLTILVDR